MIVFLLSSMLSTVPLLSISGLALAIDSVVNAIASKRLLNNVWNAWSPSSIASSFTKEIQKRIEQLYTIHIEFEEFLKWKGIPPANKLNDLLRYFSKLNLFSYELQQGCKIELGKLLGKGSYGSVHLLEQGNQKYAVKVFKNLEQVSLYEIFLQQFCTSLFNIFN